jgi:protein ImuB
MLLDGSNLPAGRTVAGTRVSEILDTLARWGVRTFRALAALPESAVRQRLGEAGAQLQRWARGEGARPFVPAEPPLKFEETVEPEYPVVLLEPLAFLLSHMLEQLCTRLEARALAAREIRLRLDLETQKTFLPQRTLRLRSGQATRYPEEKQEQKERDKRDIDFLCDLRVLCGEEVLNSLSPSQEYVLRFPVPMADPKVFLKLLQLELQTKPPGAPVTKIFLAAEPASPRFTQGGLFLPEAPEPEKLELTLARIKNIVSGFQFPVSSRTNDAPAPGNGKRETGNLRVGVAELLDSHRPDAFLMQKFNASVSRLPLSVSRKTQDTPATGNGKPGMGNFSVRTVLRRFRPPRPVRVELENSCPKTVTRYPLPVSRRTGALATGNCPAKREETGNLQVIWAVGPWHESGEWWSEDPWSREVWEVAVDQAGAIAIYRIFHDVIRNEWFVEASYD